MDLNCLFTRHQTSVMRADRAACEPSRLAHHAMAIAYADRITIMLERSGARARVPMTPSPAKAFA